MYLLLYTISVYYTSAHDKFSKDKRVQVYNTTACVVRTTTWRANAYRLYRC